MNQPTVKRAGLSAIALVILGAIFYCYEYLIRISPNVMIPDIISHFSLTAAGAGWLISLYYFAYTPLQIVVGVITDKYRAGRTLIWAIAFCTVGAALFPISHYVEIAGIGRIMTGIGSAFAYVGALSIANRVLNKNWFTFFAGAVTTLGMVGALVGDLGMSELMTHTSDWKSIFQLATIAGVILFVLFAIANYFNHRNHPENEAKTAGVSLSVSFKEMWRIIRSRRFIILGTIGAFLYLSLAVFAELWGPQFFHEAKHIPLNQATWISDFIFLGWAVGSPCQALFIKYVKIRRSLMIQCLLATMCIIAALFYIHAANWVTESLLFLFGLFCSGEILCFSQAVQWVRPEASATSIAVINFFVMLSGLIFQPVSSEIVRWAWDGTMLNGHAFYATKDYIAALSILPAATFVAFILTFFLPKPGAKHKNRPRKH